MGNAQNVGFTTREHQKHIQAIIIGLGVRMKNLATSDDAVYGLDEDEEYSELCRLSKDDKPGRVVGTTSKIVH